MKSGAVLNPRNWYSGYPGGDSDFTVLFGARNPSRTFADAQLARSKAITQLRGWMASRTPGAYRAVMRAAPHLLDSSRVGVAGLTPLGPGFMGLGDNGSTIGPSSTSYDSGAGTYSSIYANDPGGSWSPGSNIPASNTAPSTGGGPGDWASQLFNLASKAVPVVGQVQLLQTNIARAKAGLPPIDPATIAPTFHVGVAPPTLLAGGAGLAIIGGTVLAAIALSRGGRRTRRR